MIVAALDAPRLPIAMLRSHTPIGMSTEADLALRRPDRRGPVRMARP